MAELLVLAFDTHNADPEQDLFAYKLGHIIDIKPDGHPWGTQETLPKFFRVNVTGATVGECNEWIKQALDFTDLGNVKPTRIRKWKFDINSLGTAAKKKILEEGVITVTKAQVVNFMRTIS